MFSNFMYVFSLFIFYSFLGWIIEMFMENIINKKFVNRGFLIGPYCPIYGISSLLMVFFLNQYKNDIGVLFCVSLVICTLVEYITSFLLEKLFRARWWDYTNEPFNINGRVCLINSIAFGILGILLIDIINPFMSNLFLSFESNIFNIIMILVLILFVIDILISCYAVLKIKLNCPNLKKDYTKEISIKVKEFIESSGYITKRIFIAFPNIIKIPINKKK